MHRSRAGNTATTFTPGMVSGEKKPGRRQADRRREISSPMWLRCCAPRPWQKAKGKRSVHQCHPLWGGCSPSSGCSGVFQGWQKDSRGAGRTSPAPQGFVSVGWNRVALRQCISSSSVTSLWNRRSGSGQTDRKDSSCAHAVSPC